MYEESMGWPNESMRSGTGVGSKSMLLAGDNSFSPEASASAELEAAGNMVKLKSEVLFSYHFSRRSDTGSGKLKVEADML